MGDELISVIIPVYKTEAYLSQCMDSVLQQTYQNIQILLIDDGSPDNCPSLCDDYAALDHRVKVIHKPNGGLSDARNVGLKAASGSYISFIDSDDWVDCDFIERLYRAVATNAADISECGIIKVYENRHKRRNFYEADRTFSGEEARREVLKNVLTSSHACNKLFRKSLFDGIEFPIGKAYEDLYIMHHVFAKAEKVSVISDWKYYYRQRPDSIIYTPSVRNLADCFGAHFLRYAQEAAGDIELSQNLIKLAVNAALDLVKSGKPGGEYAPEFEKAKNFLRDVRHDPTLLRQLGSVTSLRVRFPWCKRGINRALKLYHKVFPRKETKQEPDWSALNEENANILLGACESENLGDSAIGFAERYFFEREGKTLVEVTEAQCRTFRKKIQQAIRPNALIMLHGGGCMGSQYMDQEDIRTWAIRSFPKNKIVHFPQTVFFAETPAAQKHKKSSVKLYGKHPDLTLFARKKYSFEIMRSMYKNCVEIVPDIVMSLPPYVSDGERSGALLMFRSDVEAALDIDQYFYIKNKLLRSGLSVEVTETRLTRRIPLEHRGKELDAFLKKVASAKIVVTDRLHGMVFSAITGTPCIVFGNYNHKLAGGHLWFKNLSYIRFCNSPQEFDQAFQNLDLDVKYSYQDVGLEGAFQPLRQAIQR